MTIPEILAAAGLPPSSASVIRRALASGTLKGRKVGTTWIVDREEAMYWIAHRRRGPWRKRDGGEEPAEP